jgi:hypothetical protein
MATPGMVVLGDNYQPPHEIRRLVVTVSCHLATHCHREKAADGLIADIPSSIL